MSASEIPERYSLPAILLHWVLAAGWCAMFGVGLYMMRLPFSPMRLQLINWHKWGGATILALSLVRLLWRLARPAPALPARMRQAMPDWQYRAYRATHRGLYVLFFCVPLTGWAYSSAAGFPVVVFGVLPLPDLLASNPALAALLRLWHHRSAYALAFLVVLHVTAALKHLWIDDDQLFQRMVPRWRAPASHHTP